MVPQKPLLTRGNAAPLVGLDKSILPVHLRAVALYARLSVNPNGTKDSVPTQLTVGRRKAGEYWPGRLVLEFSDDDLSADDDTWRPGYEAMLEAIACGQVGAVLCRVQARISRGKHVWPRFQATCLAAGVEELTTWEEGVVSMREGEDLAGDVRNMFNVHHRVTTKLGVRETLAERLNEGRPGPGRPYGLEHKRDAAGVSNYVHVPSEAKVIRRMVAWVLSGWSLASIARRLNEEGIPTKRGKKWTTGGVRTVLTNDVIAGYRTSGGKRARRGTWQPILDDATFDAVGAALSRPRKVVTNGHERILRGTRRPTRRHLLTGGITVCALCGTPLVAQMKKRHSDGVVEAVYYCSSAKGGCAKVWVNGEKLEALVVDALLSWVTTPAFRAAMAASDVDIDERERLKIERDALDQRLEDIGEQVAMGDMTSRLAGIAEKRIIEEGQALDLREAELAPLSPALSLSGEDVVQGWGGMTLEEKRSVLFVLRARVAVGQAAKRRWSFESERVDVTFFESPPVERARPVRKRAATKAKTSGGTSSIDAKRA